jgi:hypothetical protein
VLGSKQGVATVPLQSEPFASAFPGAGERKDRKMQVELKPEIEARVVADANAKGVEPSVYAGSVIELVYLQNNGGRKPARTPEEVRAWLDSLTQFSDQIPQLPEEAFTRESFYQDYE